MAINAPFDDNQSVLKSEAKQKLVVTIIKKLIRENIAT